MKKNQDNRPRLTQQGLLLLKALLEKPTEELCGADIMKITALPSGTLYPILLRFEKLGLLESHWEKGEAEVLGRPRRRFYRLTTHGREIAREALFKLALPVTTMIPISV